MIFNLEHFKPRERREAPPEKLADYAAHFAGVLRKYGYLRTEGNEAQFDAVAAYFARWYAGSSGEADYPQFGLFLYGPPGTGKTRALQIFSGLFRVEFLSLWNLSAVYACDGARALWETLRPLEAHPLILDDICNEQSVKSYGNGFPVREILDQRENSLRYHGAQTFFTTNACGPEVEDKYGIAGYSRIVGMCEKIKFGGPDMRRNPPTTVQGGAEHG